MPDLPRWADLQNLKPANRFGGPVGGAVERLIYGSGLHFPTLLSGFDPTTILN